MEKQRIFIAINLPASIKQAIGQLQEHWLKLPIRLIKPDNLHLTLVFLGYLDRQKVQQVIALTRETASRHQPFSLIFKKASLGPPGQPPRLIWLEGQKNQAAEQLKNDLDQALSGFIENGRKARSSFLPHITLARFQPYQGAQLKNQPGLNQELSLSFQVNSVEIMESFLLRSGAEYQVLKSVPLAK